MGLYSPYNTTENGANGLQNGADAGEGRSRGASVLSHQYVSQLGMEYKRSVSALRSPAQCGPPSAGETRDSPGSESGRIARRS
jgi:hypothetical protein